MNNFVGQLCAGQLFVGSAWTILLDIFLLNLLNFHLQVVLQCLATNDQISNQIR